MIRWFVTLQQASGACRKDNLGLLLIPSLICSLHQTDVWFTVVLQRCFWCPRPCAEALMQSLEVVHYGSCSGICHKTLFPQDNGLLNQYSQTWCQTHGGWWQGLGGASRHRGRLGRNLVSRDITLSVTEDKRPSWRRMALSSGADNRPR